MCGIVGYIGKNPALPILVSALKRLEYRGYDSFGFFALDDSSHFLLKKVGKISEWEKRLLEINFGGNIGIAHTRWATTGKVDERNAHPHHDCKEEIFLVHNGIIENYQQLREELVREGHQFKSDTDTEIFCHLIEKYFQGNLEEAVREALEKVQGNYAIATISKRDPNKIVLARLGAPLLIGLSDGEYFIASDPAAMVSYTRRVITLDDNEIAVITPQKHFILKEKPIENIDWEIKEAQKKGFSHFMLKEIFEEPEVIREAARGRMDIEKGLAVLGGLDQASERLDKINNIVITGCGTARYAGMVGEYMFEEYAEIPTKVEVASEFRYRKPLLNERTVLLAISQSGETADTLEAIREAKRKGALALGLVNRVGSSIARETDAGVYNRAGLEVGVAATKSFVSQLTILALLTVSLGRKKDMSLVIGKRILEELNRLPSLASRVLEQADYIKRLAQKYSKHKNFIYLGRKYNYPIALEGALKLKEIAWKVHAEGICGGEIKHGPIALVDESFPVICIVPSDSVYEKMRNAIEEVRSRNAKILAIATEGNQEIKELVDDIIYIPKTLEMLTPILSVIPLHLFAAYLGLELGLDIDKPRNLAKSVTVE